MPRTAFLTGGRRRAIAYHSPCYAALPQTPGRCCQRSQPQMHAVCARGNIRHAGAALRTELEEAARTCCSVLIGWGCASVHGGVPLPSSAAQGQVAGVATRHWRPPARRNVLKLSEDAWRRSKYVLLSAFLELSACAAAMAPGHQGPANLLPGANPCGANVFRGPSKFGLDTGHGHLQPATIAWKPSAQLPAPKVESARASHHGAVFASGRVYARIGNVRQRKSNIHLNVMRV